MGGENNLHTQNFTAHMTDTVTLADQVVLATTMVGCLSSTSNMGSCLCCILCCFLRVTTKTTTFCLITLSHALNRGCALPSPPNVPQVASAAHCKGGGQSKRPPGSRSTPRLLKALRNTAPTKRHGSGLLPSQSSATTARHPGQVKLIGFVLCLTARVRPDGLPTNSGEGAC